MTGADVRVDVEVPRFRVEWRANLTTRWMLIEAVPTRDEADALAAETLGKPGLSPGYCRIVEQRVVASSRTPWALPDEHEPSSSFGVKVLINGREVGSWTSRGDPT